MGQRHQIYVRVPAVQYSQPDNPNNRPAENFGVHHQWLYGMTAIRLAAQFMRFFENQRADNYPDLQHRGMGNPVKVLAALYCIDVAEGYYHTVHVLDNGEAENPYRGDNNDGCHVFDLENWKKPAYAFFSVGHTEGEYSLSEGRTYSAREYVTSYYLNWESEDEGKRIIGQTLLAIETKKWPVLDHARLLEIFPAMGAETAPRCEEVEALSV